MNDIISKMVAKFLGWKLPDNFNPDGGIRFTKYNEPEHLNPIPNTPVGTNLLDAIQAKAMITHLVSDLSIEPIAVSIFEPNGSHVYSIGITPEVDKDIAWYFAQDHINAAVMDEVEGAAKWRARYMQPVTLPMLAPIDRDEAMNRTYIPLPGGWEVQTKGKGSSFRLANTLTHDRFLVTDTYAHQALEQMALDIHNAVNKRT